MWKCCSLTRTSFLPESLSEQRPEPTLTIKVTADDILVEGRSIQRTDDALAQPESSLQALAGELQDQSARKPELSGRERELGRAVIIMGDRGTPYKLLKRIMATCAESGYRDISLAVNSKPPEPLAASGSGVTEGIAYACDVSGPRVAPALGVHHRG